MAFGYTTIPKPCTRLTLPSFVARRYFRHIIVCRPELGCMSNRMGNCSFALLKPTKQNRGEGGVDSESHVAVTNARFYCVSRVAVSAPSPSRPRPFFHFANRAIVTSGMLGSRKGPEEAWRFLTLKQARRKASKLLVSSLLPLLGHPPCVECCLARTQDATDFLQLK